MDKKTVDSRPWVEKYRPRHLEDISSQDDVVAVLRTTVNQLNLPHLMFYGPPGTGKTSTILALAHELFGPRIIKSRILELNASDERGINVVREKVKNFAMVTTTHSDPNYPCPPFKIIILDEADSMTAEAQAALRRTMEDYSKTTRFCLICNYSSKIIPPLASRCAKFRFKPLPTESIINRLEYICKEENISCSKDTLLELNRVSDGDLRRAVMLLQSSSAIQKKHVSPQNIRDLSGYIPDEIVDKLVSIWITQNFNDLYSEIKNIVRQGYSGQQLIQQLSVVIASHPHLTSVKKSKLGIALADTEKRLNDGSDEHLQLLNMVLRPF